MQMIEKHVAVVLVFTVCPPGAIFKQYVAVHAELGCCSRCLPRMV
jgi:hypothetical protein